MTLLMRVEGRVQRVGFRWFARTVAESFDITGTVRNLPDGSVEIAASGSEENLASFREQIELGPDGARVDRVVIEQRPEQTFPRFSIIE